MDEIISVAGINAKHSNEDQIAPYSVWTETYGDRIGNFGGLDTDALCDLNGCDIANTPNRCSMSVPQRTWCGHRQRQLYP